MHLKTIVLCNAELVRKNLIRDFQKSGLADFNFTEARNITDALIKFEPLGTDIIVMEWEMSKQVGREFIQKIRLKQRRHVPIIAITNDSTLVQLEDEGNDGGVDFYVVRPFAPPVLRAKLASFFTKMATTPKSALLQRR